MKWKTATIVLYAAAVGVMVAHGIDSTRFAEWRLLGVSAELYVLSYLPALALLVWGAVLMGRDEHVGYEFAAFAGFVVASTPVLHAPHVLGEIAFVNPLSLALIAVAGMTGLALMAAAWLSLRLWPAEKTEHPRQREGATV